MSQPGESLKKRSGWNIFYKEKSAEIKENDSTKSFLQINSEVSAIWSKMTEEQRAEYVNRANKDFNDQLSANKALGKPATDTPSQKKNESKVTPYFHYMTEQHQILRKSNPEMTYTQRSQAILKAWTNMTPVQKAKYSTVAVQEKTDAEDKTIQKADANDEDNDQNEEPLIDPEIEPESVPDHPQENQKQND